MTPFSKLRVALLLCSLPLTSALAQTKECEDALRAIAPKIATEIGKRLPAGGRVAVAPFFFDLSGSGWSIPDPSFSNTLDGEVTNRAAELVRAEVLRAIGKSKPAGCTIEDGNPDLAKYLDGFQMPRRFIDGPRAAAEVLLLTSDAVVTAVVRPSPREPKAWIVEFRWHDAQGERALLDEEEFPVGIDRDRGSLKKQVEVPAKERWGGLAESEDKVIDAEGLLCSWIEEHARAFVASPDVRAVLAGETEWLRKHTPEMEKLRGADADDLPLARILPPVLLEPSANAQRTLVEDFARVLHGTYKGLLQQLNPKSYQDSKDKARPMEVPVTFNGKTHKTYGEAEDAYRNMASELSRSAYGDLIKRINSRFTGALHRTLQQTEGMKVHWFVDPADDLSPSLWLDYCEELECFNVVVAAGKPMRYVPRLALSLTVDVTSASVTVTSKLVDIPSGVPRASETKNFSGSLSVIVVRHLQARLRAIDEMKGFIRRAWVADQEAKRSLQYRVKLAYYGLAGDRWSWYWNAWKPVDPGKLPEEKDIIPQVDELTPEQVRYWYIALGGMQ